MSRDVPLRDLLQVLYHMLVGRKPKDDEIEPFLEDFDANQPLPSIIDTIVSSVKSQEASGPEPTGIPARNVVECPIEIGVDDLMAAIAKCYESILGRQAAFFEVVARFRHILHGSSLADEIAEIAASEESTRRAAAMAQPAVDTLDVFLVYIIAVYKALLSRDIGQGEIELWYRNYLNGQTYRDIFLSISSSDEAKKRRPDGVLDDFDDGTFVQLLYELLLRRGATPGEIEHYQKLIAAGTGRLDIVSSFFVHAGHLVMASSKEDVANDPTRAYLFGKSAFATLGKWKARAQALEKSPPPQQKPFARFPFISDAAPLVSIITSLYKGADFMEAFLDNTTGQTIFDKHCELLIIDADSPEGEMEIAAPYLKKFSNIRYLRFPIKLGIYEAWNVGVKEARGIYCTNANLDDCRRADSLELQAATLDALPFVDVVYQDVLYSFEKNMKFDAIARHGFATDLPIISRYNLLEFNSPHNGPMWRRRLHDELGMFDTTYRSAGDFDFWMRCILAGKTFYKINDPHVAYYVNPQGLSTRSDTRGSMESDSITKAANRRLISPNLTMDSARFADLVGEVDSGPVEGSSRYAKAQAALRNLSVASRVVSGAMH